jgi:hypothetical protein
MRIWFVSAAALVLTIFPCLISANVQSTPIAAKPSKIIIGSEGMAVYPKISITTPTKNSFVPVGFILVTGNASQNPGGEPIKTVEVHLDKQRYLAAKPIPRGNWSNWYIKLKIPDNTPQGLHIIQARATDMIGVQSWYHVTVHVTGASANSSSSSSAFNTTAMDTQIPKQP